jgi:hypothetical protein
MIKIKKISLKTIKTKTLKKNLNEKYTPRAGLRNQADVP